MSQLADINTIFQEAMGQAENEALTADDLLLVKLEVLEALEWQDAAWDLADELVADGVDVPEWSLRTYE